MQYRVGTVTVQNGSAIVNGVDTEWVGKFGEGGLFSIPGQPGSVYVRQVLADGQLELMTAWGGPDLEGVGYWVTVDFTPFNGLPLAQPHDLDATKVIEQALLKIDELLNPLPFGLYSVYSRTQTHPPDAPNDGDAFIVPPGGAGLWTGYDTKIAVYRHGAWLFYTPANSMFLRVADEGDYSFFDGATSEWVANIFAAEAGLRVAKAGDTMTGALLMPSGSFVEPAIAAANSTNTGLFFSADGKIVSLSTEGNEAIQFKMVDGQMQGTVFGDLVVTGRTIVQNTAVIEYTDNIILLNKDQAGSPNTNAGIEIERGTATNAQILWDENDDVFRLGVIGSLQPIATREESPLDTGVPYWDAATRSFKTVAGMNWASSTFSVPGGIGATSWVTSDYAVGVKDRTTPTEKWAMYADLHSMRLWNDLNGDILTANHSTSVVNFLASPTANGNTIWHAGNDGSGSGLDADLLDGHDSSYYMPVGGGSFTGISYAPAFIATGTNAYLATENRANNAQNWIIYSQTGELNLYRGDLTGNIFTFETNGLMTSTQGTYWNSGNDGSGSGLDADLLDGYDSSYFTNIPARLGYTPVNKAGDTMSNALYFANATSFGAQCVFAYDNILYCTGGSNGLAWNNSANSVSLMTLTNAGVLKVGGNLVWHYGNDGSGSGLDADLLDGHDSTYFMPVGGGTFSGGIAVQPAGSGWVGLTGGTSTRTGYMEFYTAANVRAGYIGFGNGTDILVASENGFAYSFNNSPNVGGSTIWHAGNDGSGSGLDADLLDGCQSTYFIRKDLSDVVGNSTPLQFQSYNGGDAMAQAGEINAITVYADSPYGAYMSFHRHGQYACYFGLSTANDFRYGGWSAGATSYRFWTEANDGSGSGLDADLLDGYHGSNFIGLNGTPYYQAGTWIQLAGTAGLYAPNSGSGTHFNPTTSTYGSWTVTGSKNAWAGIHFDDAGMTVMMQTNSGASGFYVDGVGWQTYWSGGTLYCYHGATGGGTQGVVWDSANDGAGSGLDADLFDGYDSPNYLHKAGSGYYQADTWINWAGNTGLYFSNRADCELRGNQNTPHGTLEISVGLGSYAGIKFGYDANATNVVFDTAGNGGLLCGNSSYWGLYFNTSNRQLYINASSGNTVWHAGNDGSGSGLDADLLDGLDSSQFLQSATNVWHADAGGTLRYYYAAGSHTYNYSAGDYYFQTAASGTYVVTFTGAGNLNCIGTITGANLTATSSRKIKSDMRPIDDADDIIARARVYRGKKNGVEDFFVIADEVLEDAPELYHAADGESGVESVNYIGYIPVLIQKNKNLTAENIELRAMLASFNERLTRAGL